MSCENACASCGNPMTGMCQKCLQCSRCCTCHGRDEERITINERNTHDDRKR